MYSLNGQSTSLKILVLDIFNVSDVFQTVVKGRSGSTDGAAEAGVSSPGAATTSNHRIFI